MIIKTQNVSETLNFGTKLGKKLKPGSILALNGHLGAGKTVIAKGIALALNINENVTSPTYNIICEYTGSIPLYHMDLYRISDYDEFEMLGVDHLLFGKGITVIEWSERIIDELPEDIITLNICKTDNLDERVITIEGLNIE